MSRLVVLQHLDREGPGLFAKIAQEREMDLCIFRLDQGDERPQLLKGDLLLILGGSMGIRDINHPNYSWMTQELDLIKDAFSKNIGIIGVCLGAQLLAVAAGGDVEVLLEESSSNPLPEIGWGRIFFNKSSKQDLCSFWGDISFPVLHWHGDRIVLPPSAALIASSHRCKEQFFRIGDFAYGLQFHLEIEEEMFLRWIVEDNEFIKLGLGVNAESILREQQNKYGNQTFHDRLNLLRRIFDDIGF